MEGSNVPRSADANILGKYRLIAELGHGGMAEVYLAVSQGPAGFNKLVVVKQIRPQLATDPEFLTMFLDEARLAARLSHGNVVQTNEVGQDGNRYFIAMEYLEGQPLNRILHRVGRDGGLTMGMQLRIIIEMLGGLHHAHELADYDGTPLGVVHRDVTPHNVFVTYDGQIKVVDFGIAKAMNSSAETRVGVVKGKVAYMAPEQARGERVDRRADIFSAGVMIWEAATGRRLWKGIPDLTVLHRIINGDIPSPRSVVPDIPEHLEAICLRALALRKEDRYATAADLAAELDTLLVELNDRTTVREIGKLVAKHFEDNRVKIKQIVEAQLRNAKSLPTIEYQAINLPVLDDAAPAATGSGPDKDRSSASTKSERLNVDGSNGTASPSTPSSLTAATAAAEPASRSSRRAQVTAAAVAGGAVLAAALWMGMRKEPAAPVSAASPPSTNESVTAGADDQVELKITASPLDARIYVDDKPVAGNPFTGKFPKNSATHVIRAEAPGFTTRTRDLALDKNLEIEIALERLPHEETSKTEPSSAKTKAASVVTPRVPRPPPPPVDDMKQGGTKKPNRKLDDKNPYGP
jgi:serine/threonine-protein kinase